MHWLMFSCGLVMLAGAAYAAYNMLNRHVVLSVAASGSDIDEMTLVLALSRWVAGNDRRYRLKVIQKSSHEEALAALQKGEADLATARADVAIPSGLTSVSALFQEIAVVVAAPQTGITEWTHLRGRSIGVVAPTRLSDPLLRKVLSTKGLVDPKLISIAPDKIDEEVRKKTIQAIAYVAPSNGSMLGDLRAAKPMRRMKGAPLFLSVEDAEAIVAGDRRFGSVELPAGALRPSPPIPEEAATTLTVTRHLMIRRNVPSFVVTGLLSDLLEARRSLMQEVPLAAQIGAPDSERTAVVPVHPGASRFFSGDEFDLAAQLAEWAYLAPMLIGALGMCALWLYHFLWPPKIHGARDLLAECIALRNRARASRTLDDVSALEAARDEIMLAIEKQTSRHHIDAGMAAALMLAIDGVEERIDRLRASSGS